MADSVTRVDHYTLKVRDRVGEGARVLGALKQGRVNLLGFWGYPIGPGQSNLEVVPNSGAALKRAAKKAKLKLSDKRTAFLVQGRDRVGAVQQVMGKLAAAGINVHAIQAVCGGAGRYGSLVYVAPENVRGAAKALGAK
jgi:hypothetical protein